MKKLIISIFCVGLSLSAIAGDKDKDVYYGPQQGSFAVSLSAKPVAHFVGNMFNGTTDQTLEELQGTSSDIFDGTTLDIKFYPSDYIGLTVGAGFNCNSRNIFNYDYNDNEDIIGKQTEKNTDVMLTLGAQYLIRPGARWQPVLGTRLMCMFGNEVEKYTDYDNDSNNYRNGSPDFAIGLIGDLGVEYFFTKNFSLSAIADLGLYHSTSKVSVNSDDDSYSKKLSSNTGFVTGMFGGNIVLNFYF